ncbi:TonB-dependent receptor plug domain-containing protein [Helicobacter saguini]|uniref:TonB-dependent receptor plug domain-containing protein n=1 Tax=Helicobacter saguini TaxID=1548018 RepID=UPI001F18DF7F|nr:TonB-dependent receptor plug domain-containing protein [Helicobacter saguini]
MQTTYNGGGVNRLLLATFVFLFGLFGVLDSKENIESKLQDSKDSKNIESKFALRNSKENIESKLAFVDKQDSIESKNLNAAHRPTSKEDSIESKNIESKNAKVDVSRSLNMTDNKDSKVLILAENETKESNSLSPIHRPTNEKDSNAIDSKNTTKDSKNNTIESYKLNAVTTTANNPLKTYQSSSGVLNKEMLDSNPSGNGDITSILKILPNVQFDNAQLKSTTPGEIDPANISISGGLFYQNNFQLDGFNMNNDLDPNGGTTNGPNAMRSGRSQGLAVDTSLLDSINVQDSNISAAYGGFTGGVVEANIRKPRRDKGMLGSWHANINYQYTSNYFTQYFVDSSQEANFATSSNENYQPNFTKHLVRANVEGYVTNNLGIIASYSTTRSFIPLKAYSFNVGSAANSTRQQHRYIDNYYVKLNYNPLESLNIEASLAYMPQDNTYYNNVAKDSFYSMQSGGWQAGLKALWYSNLGLLTNQMSYNYLQNSRESERNYFMTWRVSSTKNWASANATGTASEGGYGNMQQVQNTFNYKSDMGFETIEWWKSAHNFRVGLELGYTHALRNRLNPYYSFGLPQNLNGATCGSDSMFSFDTCDSATAYSGNATWQGQYFNRVTESKVGEIAFGTFSYGIYVEDDIKFDLGKFGNIGFRPGFRLDGDDYMKKHTIAPRFSLNYTTPFKNEYKTTFILGANRYYGRNLLSYRLYDFIANNQIIYTRPNANTAWSATTNTAGDSGYVNFTTLNVPYADEYMAGISQNLYMFEMALKYIYRGGKDEIMRQRPNATTNNCQPPTNLNTTNIPCSWSNDGTSQSHIITLSIQNNKNIETFGVKHYYLLAFDYTNTRRSYNIYAADDAYADDVDVLYNGQIIKYRDRPTENFARPYTLRFNTTHTFNIWKTKWMWNNFFRLRGAYDAMVLIAQNQAGYNQNYANLTQYGKRHFKEAFTWDMRIGFEIDVWNKNTLYVNLDIYNVLDSKNMTALSSANSGAITQGIATAATAVAVYEIGRQFWLQVGYKF